MDMTSLDRRDPDPETVKQSAMPEPMGLAFSHGAAGRDRPLADAECG